MVGGEKRGNWSALLMNNAEYKVMFRHSLFFFLYIWNNIFVFHTENTQPIFSKMLVNQVLHIEKSTQIKGIKDWTW